MSHQRLGNNFARAFTDRRFLAAHMVAFAGMALVAFFPGAETVSTMLMLLLVGYGLLPAIFVRFVLKESIASYGFHWGKGQPFPTLGFLVLMLAIALGAVWSFLSFTDAGLRYVDGTNIALLRGSFSAFLIFSALSLPVLFLTEAFFRGFLLGIWRRYFGIWSVVLSVVATLSLSWIRASDVSSHAFFGEMTILAIGSICASIIAFFSGSYLLSFCFFFFFDTLSTVFAMILS